MSDPEATRAPRLSATDGVLMFAVCLPYAWLVRRFWFVCDDAFISFRYAQNWADGNGLRYNLGDHTPVEGFSNFLWVVIAAVVHALGGELPHVMPWLSAGLGAGLVALIYLAARQHFDASRTVAAMASLSAGMFPPFAVWASGGLETMAFALAFFATTERLVLRRRGPDPWRGSLAAVCLALLRVEGFAWVIVLVLGACVTHAGRVRWQSWLPRFASIVVPSFTAFWTARALYFQNLVPNTVTAKVGVGDDSLVTGFNYVATFALTFVPCLVVPFVLPAALRQGRRFAALIIVWGGVFCYAVAIGGDFMAMGRVVIPAVALQGLILALALSRLLARWNAWIGASLALIGVGLLPGWNVDVVPRSVTKPFHFRLNAILVRSEYEQWEYMRENTEDRTLTALALRDYIKPGDSLVRGAIGVIGFYSGAYIYDTYGLVTRTVAERDADPTEELSPGHKKKVELAYFLDQRPDIMVVRSFRFPAQDGVAAFRKKARSTIRGWTKEGIEEFYVPDLVQLDPVEPDEVHFLLVYRRIPDGTSSTEAWAQFQRKLQGL